MRSCHPVIILFLLLSVILAGCGPNHEDLMREERLRTLYAERESGFSEFRAKMIEDPFWVRRREQLLGGTLPMSRRALRQALDRLEREIETGRNWNTPVPSAKIPFTAQPPVIDGKLDPAEWRTALTYRGEFPLNSESPGAQPTEWKLQYDREFLYFAVRVFDSAVIPGPRSAPYRGDSVELFLYPDTRLVDYLETVISADGVLYNARAAQSRKRHYDLEISHIPKACAKAVRLSDGFSIELKLPFSALPGYLLGNPPKRGETMNFMMLRCDLSPDGQYTRSAPVPFLYDGHNIYGYIRGVLD